MRFFVACVPRKSHKKQRAPCCRLALRVVTGAQDGEGGRHREDGERPRRERQAANVGLTEAARHVPGTVQVDPRLSPPILPPPAPLVFVDGVL